MFYTTCFLCCACVSLSHHSVFDDHLSHLSYMPQQTNVFLCSRSCTMLAPSRNLCQRCVRLLSRSRMSVIKPPLTSQQPFDGHQTSVRGIYSILSPHLNVHQTSSQTTEDWLGVGLFRGLCDSSAIQRQVIQHDCESPEARNITSYKHAQTPSRKPPVTTQIGEYANVSQSQFTFFI